MKEISIQFDRIENYLLGLMSQAEKTAFESELSNDPVLAAEVRVQQAELLAFDLALQQDLRANLASWKQEKKAASSSLFVAESNISVLQVSYFRRHLYQIAAAACVLLVVGFWGFAQFGNASKDMWASELTESRERTLASTAFSAVQTAMKQKKWGEALVLLNQMNEPKWLDTIALLKAECYFNEGKYQEAINILTLIVENPQSKSNGKKAEYNLLVCYYEKGDKAKAHFWQEKIKSDQNHPYLEKANRFSLD